jgi:hypothetical protein
MARAAQFDLMRDSKSPFPYQRYYTRVELKFLAMVLELDLESSFIDRKLCHTKFRSLDLYACTKSSEDDISGATN